LTSCHGRIQVEVRVHGRIYDQLNNEQERRHKQKLTNIENRILRFGNDYELSLHEFFLLAEWGDRVNIEVGVCSWIWTTNESMVLDSQDIGRESSQISKLGYWTGRVTSISLSSASACPSRTSAALAG
jgi:hypothetical protein